MRTAKSEELIRKKIGRGEKGGERREMGEKKDHKRMLIRKKMKKEEKGKTTAKIIITISNNLFRKKMEREKERKSGEMGEKDNKKNTHYEENVKRRAGRIRKGDGRREEI